MLVLTRKVGQKIIINENEVTITYLGEDFHHPDQVRIGISAPANYEIHREEIFEKIIKHGRYHNKHKKPT